VLPAINESKYLNLHDYAIINGSTLFFLSYTIISLKSVRIWNREMDDADVVLTRNYTRGKCEELIILFKNGEIMYNFLSSFGFT